MRLFFLSSCLVLTLACDGPVDADDPPGDDQNDETAWTGAAFCQALSERVCAGLSACGCRFDVRAYDANGCVAARTAECQDGFADRIQPDITAGFVRFDAAAVTACLADLEALAIACDLPRDDGPLPASCDRVVLATATVGQPCRISGTAYCAHGLGLCVSGGSGGSTCAALPGAEQPCLDGRCAPDLVCRGGAAPVCSPPAESGATCGSDRECGADLVCSPEGECAAPGAASTPCASNADCAEGLACVDGSCADATPLGEGCSGPPACGAGRSCGRAPETRTCTDPDGEGAACTSDTCAEGLLCGYESEVCEALPGDGEPCLDGHACAPGFTCADGLGTCAALPGEGEPCATGSRFCAEGLGCRESDWTCQPAESAGEGEPCLLNPPDYVCASGLGCDFGTGGSICMPLTGAGTPCNTDRTCSAETYCELSQLACAARLADGSTCSDGNECLPGSECALVPAGPLCARIPSRDEPCISQCTTGLACKGPGGQCVPAFCVIP